MELWILLALQLAATGLGFAYLWRRQRQLSDEVARLRTTLAAAAAERTVQRRRTRGGGAQVDEAQIIPLAAAGGQAEIWRPAEDVGLAEALFSHRETLRGLLLGLIAVAPAFGFFAGVESAAVTAIGLGVALAMTLLGLRQDWQASAWAAAVTAIGWALFGFVSGAAHASPIIYSVFLAFCGAAGLLHAHLRRTPAGAVIALGAAAMALALAGQIGVISAAGAAFGVIVTAAAIVGALSLRLEAMHLAAFGAALIGLFVLSGQNAAAIWFTPAVAWAGAVFLAIAAVRVPQLGARGVALAGTGALAPLLAAGALHAAQHGLADRYAAAGAFLALAAALAGLIALAASRRANGLAALRATLWVLTIAAFIAASAAILLALPAPFAAPAFAALAFGLAALNTRFTDAAWRAFSCIAALCAGVMAYETAQMLLLETPGWNPWLLIGAGLGLPAALLGASAMFAGRMGAKATAGLQEVLLFALAVAAANLVVRLYFSAGATLLAPIGFVEAGAHVSVWLLASLLIASHARRGAGETRVAAATTLGGLALFSAAFAGVLWLTPFWSAREAVTTAAPIQQAPLGFLAPALFAWAHWVFWRAHGSEVRTRVAFAAGGAFSAGYVVLEALRNGELPDWARALLVALALALAVIINFAPGVVGSAPRSYREENFHRHRRRQQSV